MQHNANGSSIFRVLLTCELGFSEMDGSKDGAIDVEGSDSVVLTAMEPMTG